MQNRIQNILIVLTVALGLAGLQACAVADNDSALDWHGGTGDFTSDYVIDYDKFNSQWPSNRAAENPEDAFSVLVNLGTVQLTAPTHLFDAPMQLIPYSNDDNVVDAKGVSFPRGDQVIAEAFPVGVVGYAINMVKAIAGDEEARSWFKDGENLIYCAELAHVSTSAGILVPLNEQTLVPEVGQELWDNFVAEVDKQLAGESSAFTEMNENPRAALVMPALAPEWLSAMPAYAPSDLQEEAEEKLAFQPMTAADIVQQFMRTHIPREILGETLAPVQGQVLVQMKPGLFESMGLDQLAETDPARMAAEDVFMRLVEVVSTSYGSYDEFQEALRPIMDEARALTGPRDDSGNGLFVPPSLLHVITQGKHDGGLIGLDYVGHGLHVTMLYEEGADEETDDETTDDETTDDETTDPEPWEGMEYTGAVEQGEEYHTETTELATGQYMFALTHDEANPGGDADLYVRVGKEPTMDEYECRPWKTGSDEECEIDLAEGDVIYLMVYGYDEGSNAFQLSGILAD